MRTRFAIAATILTGLLLASSLSPLAAAQSTGGIGGRPANPDPDNPRTQSIFIYTLDKGQTASDEVRISNNSDTKQTIELLAVDGVVTNTGAFTCKQNSEEKTDLGAAITLEQAELTLEPNTNQLVKFTVAMPETADVGERNACLVFQSKEDDGEIEGNVRIRTRQAIRVVATVPGDLQRDVTISSFNVAHENDTEVFALSLQNTGNVSADVNSEIEVKNLFGQTVYRDGGEYPILADQKLDLRFENPKRPFFGGWFTAQAAISYDKRAGEFGTNDQSQLITKESDSQTVFIAPTTAGKFTLIIIAVLLIAALITWLLSRRRRQSDARNWVNYSVKPGDTIESIAAERGISWKKLASRNNLKAPYSLDHTEILKVPPFSQAADTDDHANRK